MGGVGERWRDAGGEGRMEGRRESGREGGKEGGREEAHSPSPGSRSPERRPTAAAGRSAEGFPPESAGTARRGPAGGGGPGPGPPGSEPAPLPSGRALGAAAPGERPRSGFTELTSEVEAEVKRT